MTIACGNDDGMRKMEGQVSRGTPGQGEDKELSHNIWERAQESTYNQVVSGKSSNITRRLHVTQRLWPALYYTRLDI